MSKFSDFNSDELNLIKSIFTQLHYLQLDINIAYIVEQYIYDIVKEYYPLKEGEKIKLKCEYKLRFDKKNGQYKEFYPNGNKIVECFYSNDKKEGKCITWNPISEGNNKIVECFYSEGKLNGEYIDYYPENGNKCETYFYSKGKKNGKYIHYYNNSTNSIHIECFLNDDIFESDYKEYSEDGNLIIHNVY